MNKDKIQKRISKLPISSYNKIRLYRTFTHIYWWLYCSSEERKKRFGYNILTPSGDYYGHEQWLKKYCDYKDPIFAYIEHGVYFGDNTSKVGWAPEWDLGNIITFGDSRYNLLKNIYPDYNILRIGPRVHYAPTDMSYYEEIKSKLIPGAKTMTLYPFHSIQSDPHKFNTSLFMKGALEVAKSFGIKNILVSLHPRDFEHGLNLQYKDTNVILVTGGSDNSGFLPRLRTIMELSDLTYSNALGTHVGYSIYLGTPHILDTHSNQPQDGRKTRYREEQAMFARVFSGKNGLNISKEQYELCDYYWGFRHVKTPEVLYKELEACKSNFEHNFRH